MTHELTPDEQRFFETGELTPDLQQQHAAAVDPLALAGVSNVESPAAPAPAPAAPAPAPSVEPPAPQNTDAIEILRRSLAEAQQRVGQLEQHIQQSTQQTQPKIEAPDPAIDPLGHMTHQLAEVNKTVLALQNQLQQQTTQQQTVENFRQFQQQIQQLKTKFAEATPDFDAAYSHLRNTRIEDLRVLGLNDSQIQRALFHEETVLAENAIRNGRNPAEVVYETAKRHGYQAKAAQAPAAPPATPDAKLTAIQQAQAAAKNLPKSMNADDFTLEGLKEVGDQDLNKLVMDDKLWAKIVGSDTYPL